MLRRKPTAIEYLEEQALFVPFVIGDLIEHFGDALQKWTFGIDAARKGDWDRALTYLVEAEIAIDVPMRVSRQELKQVIGKASDLVDAELPEGDDESATSAPYPHLKPASDGYQGARPTSASTISRA
jgi:hypothetical protein